MKSSELFGFVRTPEQLARVMDKLIDGWCERRCLRELRHVLPGWPLVSGLTDDWGDLLAAIKSVECFEDGALIDEERELLRGARLFVEGVLEDR